MTKSFVLRLDPKLFEVLKRQATVEKLSINAHCVSLLAQRTQATEKSLAVAKELQRVWGDDLLSVVFFGSAARGTATAASDLDLMIVLQEDSPIGTSLYRRWDKLFEETFAKVSPHFVHLPHDLDQAGSLWLEVAMEGKVLFDTLGRMESSLRQLRQLIAEGRYQRAYSYGVPYWKKVA